MGTNMTAAKILADQIGMLVIANAEQAALITQLQEELSKLKSQQFKPAPNEKVLVDESGLGGGYG